MITTNIVNPSTAASTIIIVVELLVSLSLSLLVCPLLVLVGKSETVYSNKANISNAIIVTSVANNKLYILNYSLTYSYHS